MQPHLLCLILLLIVWLPPALAIQTIQLNLGSVEGQGIALDDIQLQLGLQGEHPNVKLTIAKATIPNIPKPLTAIEVSCTHLIRTSAKLECQRGQFGLAGRWLDSRNNRFAFSYQFDPQQLQLKINPLYFAKARIQVTLNYADNAWQAQVSTQKINIETVLQRIKPLVDILPKAYSLAGDTGLSLQAQGQGAVLETASLKADLQNLSFSNPTASQIAEGLWLKVAVQAKPKDTAWTVSGDLTAQQGEVYIEPIYLALSADKPLRLNADVTWDAPQLRLRTLRYHHQDILDVQTQGRFTLGENFAIEQLAVNIPRTPLQPIYDQYLAGWLETLKFGSLTTGGEFTADLQWQPDFQQLITRLYQINLEDTAQSFGLFKLNGQFNWQQGKIRPRASHLTWQRGYFLSNIEVGNSYLNMTLHNNALRLGTAWHIPILDGALEIEDLYLNQLGQPDMQGQLQGRLSPISMQSLSQALELPPLSGHLSGKIPTVKYQDNMAHVDGSIHFKVFEGDVRITDLRVSELLGRLPIVTAHIDIHTLNLARITEFFREFGAIQGQLSGKVHNLRLLNWLPVSFDAYLGTPDDNRLPRKISQTAVRNLSNLGGGGGVVDAISQQVLGLFENFSYDKLGLGCRLENGVCRMSGAAPAPQGYYIVKGGSIPRIDVIGYNQQVDWDELWHRLQALSSAEAPVIK